MSTLSLTVNGRTVCANAPGATPLLYVLRNDLGLKGSRYGCGIGECGACSVLIDGVRRTSCDLPAYEACGKEVTTVESVATDNTLKVIRSCFLDEQAFQCAYCTNGIMMGTLALLRKHPVPTDNQVRETLDRHLCRCGSHGRVLKAVHRAAAALQRQSGAEGGT